MGFMGSTGYYVLCIVALIILASALVILQTKPKHHPKNTKTDYQQPLSEHIPKYAAGDDMDQINRKAYALWSEKKSSTKEVPIIIIGTLVLCGILLSEFNKTKTTPQSPLSPAPTQPSTSVTTSEPIMIPDGKLQAELNSAEFNSDRTKIFITYTYSNESNTSFYSVVTTIDLQDENDVVLQSKIADTIDSIIPTETKEITTSITIDPENIGKIRRVEIHTKYQRQ